MERPAASDPAEISPYLWFGFSGNLGFDVGANCGQSLPLMTARFGRVVAFEPAAESWEVLHRDYGTAHGVTLVNAAVSSTGGETELYETPSNLAQGQLTSPGHSAFGTEGQPVPRTVACMTMDEAAAKYGMPDFAKVDTEGHELKILQGAGSVIAAGTAWLIEFHSPAMHDGCEGILLRAGCKVETVRHPHYPPGTENWYHHGWLKAVRA